MSMKIKEEHLDKNISCPFTGKHLWVRELEPSVYSHYSSKGYEWLFEEEVKEISEEEFFTEPTKKKK
jgi:hypothetical protein